MFNVCVHKENCSITLISKYLSHLIQVTQVCLTPESPDPGNSDVSHAWVTWPRCVSRLSHMIQVWDLLLQSSFILWSWELYWILLTSCCWIFMVIVNRCAYISISQGSILGLILFQLDISMIWPIFPNVLTVLVLAVLVHTVTVLAVLVLAVPMRTVCMLTMPLRT